MEYLALLLALDKQCFNFKRRLSSGFKFLR
nr:MAG TPA: hypothetical protein [Caudoviricetes sp.]